MTVHNDRNTDDSSSTYPSTERPVLRISSAGELIGAVPYLLGFVPTDSLVVIGLSVTGRLVVTARMDLADATTEHLHDALQAAHRGGATDLAAIIYPAESPGTGRLPHPGVVDVVRQAAERMRLRLIDLLLVCDGRWWSYDCTDSSCCPPAGNALTAVSAFCAEAVAAGLVPLGSRDELAATLDKRGDPEQYRTLLAISEQTLQDQLIAGTLHRWQRGVKRAIFAAARTGDAVPMAELARFAVAMRGSRVRDAVWLAVDDRRLQNPQLWRQMATELPGPYDAAPLFLLGWHAWRDGNGALANIAADKAIAADPAYSAANLLLAALDRGLDPRRLPRLRMPDAATSPSGTA